MGNFGGAFNMGLGSSPNHTVYAKPTLMSDKTMIRVEFEPAAGWGNTYFGLYINAQLKSIVYAPEGQASFLDAQRDFGSNDQSFTVLRQGANGALNMFRVARTYQDTALVNTIDLTWPYEISATLNADGTDLDELSTWVLDGILYDNAFQSDRLTRRRLVVNATLSGGNITITLSNSNQDVASGTGAYPGSVTLAELNSSGISGSVTVGTPLADIVGAEVIIRYPKSMTVYRGLVDPPTANVDSISFAGIDTQRWTESANLSADTYYYALEGISDTGDVGDKSTAQDVIIAAPPVAPTSLGYASGTAANTVVDFTPSTTVGATYNVYFKNIDDDYIDTDNPQQTLIAGSTSATLPAITGYPGTVRIIIRAESGGIEEKNSSELALEYDSSGDFVPTRPIAPSILDAIVSNSNTVTVTGTWNAAGAIATATILKLFTREADAAYNFSTPADTQSLSGSGNVRKALLSTAPANGYHYVTLKSYTASGVASIGQATEKRIYVSDVNTDAPTFDVVNSRG